MQLCDLAIINGTLVIPHLGLCKAHVGITDGKISYLGSQDPSSEAGEVIDAEGKYVFPGLIDPHVHFGNYFPFLQDFRSETKSAAAGGITCIVTQLKVRLFSSELQSYFPIWDKVLEDLRGLSTVDYSFHFNIPEAQFANEISSYYRKLGIQSYKLFMAYKPQNLQGDTMHLQKTLTGMDDGAIYSILRTVGKLDMAPLMTVHCECDDVIKYTTTEAKEAGLRGLVGWDAARPDITEELAIAQLGAIASYTGAHVYVVHVSSKRGLEIIRREKQRRTHMRAETCPHYLWLTTDQEGTYAKVAPPVRSREDVEALWGGIRDGSIDCMGTDHVAKPRKTKVSNIWEAALAFQGLETMLPLTITGAMQRGIPLEKVAEICSFNTARTFGLFPKKGTILVGGEADLVITDLNEKRRIEAINLHSEADFTPFEGLEVWGWPVTTILRGKKIFDRGRFLNEGQGSFVPRYPQDPN